MSPAVRSFTKIYLRNFEISWNFSIAFYPDSYVFMCFEIAQVYLPSAASRVYGGRLQNELVIKPFRKHPKSSKFVCIKSSLPCMHNLHPFYRNSKISRNSSYRFLWNFAQQKIFNQRMRSVKHFKRKCRIGLKFDWELKHCDVITMWHLFRSPKK